MSEQLPLQILTWATPVAAIGYLAATRRRAPRAASRAILAFGGLLILCVWMMLVWSKWLMPLVYANGGWIGLTADTILDVTRVITFLLRAGCVFVLLTAVMADRPTPPAEN